MVNSLLRLAFFVLVGEVISLLDSYLTEVCELVDFGNKGQLPQTPASIVAPVDAGFLVVECSS